MKYIKLNHDKKTKVSNVDFKRLSLFNWFAEYHAGGWRVATNVKSGKVWHRKFMHRLIFYNLPKEMEVDHINGDTLDNRRSNLRVCTKTQNLQNSKLSKDSKNKYKGITFVKRYKTKPWKASIMLKGKRYWLGQYATQEEAGKAYDKKAVELFGEFARLNFPSVYQQGYRAGRKCDGKKYSKQVEAFDNTVGQTGLEEAYKIVKKHYPFQKSLAEELGQTGLKCSSKK